MGICGFLFDFERIRGFLVVFIPFLVIFLCVVKDEWKDDLRDKQKLSGFPIFYLQKLANFKKNFIYNLKKFYFPFTAYTVPL